MESLQNLLEQLENNVVNWSCLSPEISKASVGWHIEHTLLTFDAIVKTMEASKPEEYKKRFSLPKVIVMTFEFIPRGKAESPRYVRPRGDITVESLKNHFQTSYALIKKLHSLRGNSYFEHPYFGHLKAKPAIKFTRIHTRHHLKIINDIVKRSKM